MIVTGRLMRCSGISILQMLLAGARWFAYGAGFLLGYVGWVTFGASVFCLMLFPVHAAEIAKAFHLAGYCLLPAWILLCLALKTGSEVKSIRNEACLPPDSLG